MRQPRETCKPWRGSQPLCGRFDPDIIDHVVTPSIARCEEVHDLIRNGLAAASIHIEANPFPSNEADFYDSI